MKFLPLSVNEKAVFDSYLLKEKPRVLSSYSFENTFIWRALFDITWSVVNEKFCVFFKNGTGCFMPMPPLGSPDLKTVGACFEVMQNFNHNDDISRIENVQEDALDFFKKNSFRFYEKTREYIVCQKDMSFLKGEKFRHKRNLRNFFIKNHKCVFRDYEAGDCEAVLGLYKDWMAERRTKNSDPIYQAMLSDNFTALSELLNSFGSLDFSAKVVECDGALRGFISGHAINPGLFCINFEIADLAFKGLPQFIFSEFSRSLSLYPNINIMDDSCIKNIRQTKLSYRPVDQVASYTVLAQT